MQVVIDIPEDTFNHIYNGGSTGASLLIENAIKNGVQLPEGHDRLVDMKDLIKLAKNYSPYDVVGLILADRTDYLPTIVEADNKYPCKETGSEKNITREERKNAISFLKRYLDEVIFTDQCINAHKMAIKALEEEPILDKIRAEIDGAKKPENQMSFFRDGIDCALQIIDKYKTEKSKEEEIEEIDR